MKERIINGIKFTHTDRNGWSAVSIATGRDYDLLEAKSYMGNSSADIVMVFYNGTEEEMKNNPEICSKIIDFSYGAFEEEEGSLCFAANTINDFEEENGLLPKEEIYDVSITVGVKAHNENEATLILKNKVNNLFAKANEDMKIAMSIKVVREEA